MLPYRLGRQLEYGCSLSDKLNIKNNEKTTWVSTCNRVISFLCDFWVTHTTWAAVMYLSIGCFWSTTRRLNFGFPNNVFQEYIAGSKGFLNFQWHRVLIQREIMHYDGVWPAESFSRREKCFSKVRLWKTKHRNSLLKPAFTFIKITIFHTD